MYICDKGAKGKWSWLWPLFVIFSPSFIYVVLFATRMCIFKVAWIYKRNFWNFFGDIEMIKSIGECISLGISLLSVASISYIFFKIEVYTKFIFLQTAICFFTFFFLASFASFCIQRILIPDTKLHILPINHFLSVNRELLSMHACLAYSLYS